MDETAKAIQQRELYGESLGVLVGRVREGLGLNQSGIAAVLGLSPAMLSQLVTGQRVKIANPLAVARLQSLLVLADESGDLPQHAVAERLDAIRDSRVTLTGAAPPKPAMSNVETARAIGALLRAVASGAELHRAAQALDDVAPGLAEVLRVYGAGSPEEAAEHLAAIDHLLRT